MAAGVIIRSAQAASVIPEEAYPKTEEACTKAGQIGFDAAWRHRPCSQGLAIRPCHGGYSRPMPLCKKSSCPTGGWQFAEVRQSTEHSNSRDIPRWRTPRLEGRRSGVQGSV